MLSTENMTLFYKVGKCGKSWSKSPLLVGITLIFKMAVLRRHTVFSYVYMTKFPRRRMYSCNSRLKLVRKHSPAVFKRNFKIAFAKDHANE